MTTTTETFAHLPLAHIVASLTNPRKTFNPERLAELAESIRASGVHQPVLVRPLPAHRVADTAYMDPRPTFELVSGERRLRASIMAEMDSVPAMVRALTDDQVLDIQLVENLQRDDLQPLEEAEGYSHLMAHHDPALTADDVAQRIGKSRSYVYARLKLLDLCPEAREALRQSHINAAVALLIARIPSHTVQAQALGNVNNPMTGQALSVRDASALIQRQYMLRLTEARFKITDATLVPIAGSCRQCPKRTGADPDLFADVPGADVCTDVACFRAKEQAHIDAMLQAAVDSGAVVIAGREAQQITLHTADGRLDGYLRLDDKRDSPSKGQTLRQIIGPLMEAEGMQPTLIAMPDHDPVAAITTTDATRLLALHQRAEEKAQLKTKTRSNSKASAEAASELQKQQDHEHFNGAWRWRVLERAWGKISGIEESMYSLPEAVIRQLARDHLPKQKEQTARLCDLLQLGKVGQAQALVEWVNNHPDPDRALALLLLFEAATNWQAPLTSGPLFMVAIAEDKRVELDIDAIRDEVQAEHTAAIQARTKVQPGATCTGSQTPDAPLPSAAQAGGVRGGKAKKSPAAPAPKKPKTSAREAMQGIAAAMQGQGEEGGADSGPSGTEPDGASAVGEEGRATSPDAGAAELFPLKVGSRVLVKSIKVHGVVTSNDVWGIKVLLHGSTGDASFTRDELIHLVDEVAWPFPQVAA